MKNLTKTFTLELLKFRKQGLEVSDINPISALADTIFEKLYSGKIKKKDISYTLEKISQDLMKAQITNLKKKVSLSNKKFNINFNNLDITKPVYQAVFTAHPVFRFTKNLSNEISKNASDKAKTKIKNIINIRDGISLEEEHNEAIKAIFNARDAINDINFEIINENKKINKNWKNELPLLLGVSTWVGYDLDGRSDINWRTSFTLRLKEKKQSLEYYIKNLNFLKISEVNSIVNSLKKELDDTNLAIESFSNINKSTKHFSKNINNFTNRPSKLCSSFSISEKIHNIAIKLSDDEDITNLMLIASDIRKHGFGVGEIHLRVNATQVRNAMRPVDGKGIYISKSEVSSRVLMDRLSKLIINDKPWTINFKNLELESSTARRQLMLAKQILKYIDKDQPIRFLIAECEKPITILSALYLAKKLGIDHKVDISPLFETTKALEHGHQVIEQLFSYKAYAQYIKKRKQISIQTGFSDAGRFIGQIAANLAIERLQLKIAAAIKKNFNEDITLLLFNTHGESLGRGGGQLNIKDRQDFVLTPFVRNSLKSLNLPLFHQTSFQGGDGYLLFGTKKLAKSTLLNILRHELEDVKHNFKNDLFYKKSDFALDLFLSLKDFQEKIYNDPSYFSLLTTFSNNLLPKTGSRPSKRVLQAGLERQDPSSIRAIPHNANLQQLGFLVNVISGFGKSALLDLDQFLEVHKQSSRLKQCLEHVLNAKSLGSLNTTLAYSKLVDGGFWVNKSYHGKQDENLISFRRLSSHLLKHPIPYNIKKIVWKLRDDLLDLYRLTELTNKKSIRVANKERSDLDILHSIRIAIIIESIILLSKVPSIAESNEYSNDDIIALGLKLDFINACNIIKTIFSSGSIIDQSVMLSEKENYSKINKGNYQLIEKNILKPIEQNQKLIFLISNLISNKYGALG